MSTPKGNKRRKVHKHEIDESIDWANGILEENDFKEIWQVVKTMKLLVDTLDNLEEQILIDIYFIWGTALSRLSSLDYDAELAEAAVDKFEEIKKIGGENALGSTGFVLWGSSLIILGLNHSNDSFISKGLQLFEKACDINPKEFEVHYQYAKAMKEAIDYLASNPDLEKDSNALSYVNNLVFKAKRVCSDLYDMFSPALSKLEEQEQPEDEDVICASDISDLLQLHAKVIESSASLEKDKKYETFNDAYDIYKRSLEYCNENYDSVIGINKLLIFHGENFYSVKEEAFKNRIHWVEENIRNLIRQNEIDTNSLPCLDEKEEDIEIPTNILDLIDSLGSNLFEQLRLDCARVSSKSVFKEIDTILQWVHSQDPSLGCYTLARMYAVFGPTKGDYRACRDWLEICETYEVFQRNDICRNLKSDPCFKYIYQKQWFLEIVNSVE